ncbi:MAG: PAS domain S-box protein [Methanoregula sp.]|nr:PAS domain S-box protein [Methanoregula sp.]
MKKCNILIVEDEALIAANLVHTLSSLGYAVHKPVATGEDAIRAVKARQPDLVLMDIELIGEMNGIEAAEKIRAIADIPIVYLTAYSDDLHLKQARLTEPYGYIVKPAHSRELHAMIEMALYKHSLDRKLKESEENYRNLSTMMHLMCDNMPDMIWAKDLDKRYIFANKAICRNLLNAADNNEPTGKNDMFFAERERTRHADNPAWHTFGEICRDTDQITMDAGTPQQFDEYGNVQGKYLFLDVHKAPFIDEQGIMIGTVGSARDVTVSKQLEEALAESEKSYRGLFNTIRQAIYILNPDGTFVDVNEGAEAMYGYTREEFIGRTPEFLSAPGKNDLAAVMEYIRKAFAGEPQLFGFWGLRKNGERFPKDVSLYKGTYFGKDVIVAVGADITERKRMEDALVLASKKLALLSGITRHDINNQMTILMGYLTILKKKQPDPTLTEYFQKVSTAAQRISSMIQFTREYENIGVHAPVWQDCRSLVDTAAKEASLGKVVVKNDLPAGAKVFADPLVVKVFYNLMDNAARYGGKITTIRFSVEERDGDHVVVCEDDGNGVVAEEKERIFEKGFGKNTGLGLALSREILSITGITIHETGEPGKGARFEMTVPKGAWRVA